MSLQAELLVTGCHLQVDGLGLARFAAAAEACLARGPLQWQRYDDGGPSPKAALRGPAFAAFFVRTAPDQARLWRLDTGLSLPWQPGQAQALADCVAQQGGTLTAVLRDANCVDHEQVHAEASADTRAPQGGLIPEWFGAPEWAQPALLTLKATAAQSWMGRLTDPSPPLSVLMEAVDERALAPALAQHPALNREVAEALLRELLQRGPWDVVHTLARHPVWADELPGPLRRAPFLPAAQRRALYQGPLQTSDDDHLRAAQALERLLCWPCEVDLDTHNLAPWLPPGAPEAAVEAFLGPALEAGFFAQDVPGAPAIRDDQVVCWSLPPLRPSPFQRLLAAHRASGLSAGLRQRVAQTLAALSLSPALERALLRG